MANIASPERGTVVLYLKAAERQQQMTTWKQQPATGKQYGLIKSLAQERDLSGEALARLVQRLTARDMTKGTASATITWLVAQPKAFREDLMELRANGIPVPEDQPGAVHEDYAPGGVFHEPVRGGSTDAPKVTTPGMFRCDGEVYVVVKGRQSGKHYAKRLVELRDSQGDRLTDDDGHVRFDFDYERGAIFKLDESMRLDQDEAKALAVRYGKCAMCGRKLKVAASVERGYGPVCWSRFTPSRNEATV